MFCFGIHDMMYEHYNVTIENNMKMWVIRFDAVYNNTHTFPEGLSFNTLMYSFGEFRGEVRFFSIEVEYPDHCIEQGE